MARTIEDLKKRHNELQALIARANLPGAKLREQKASEDRARWVRENEDRKAAGEKIEEIDLFRADQESATAVANARRDRARAEFAVNELRQECDQLALMLTGHDRVELARKSRAEVRREQAQARTAVTEAEAAVSRITHMLAAEKAAFESARTGAAARLLAAIKGGGDTEVPPASRDKVAMLEMAKVAADQELTAARAALAAVEMRGQSAFQLVLDAQRDVAALAHELAFDVYVEALAEFMEAHWRAHRQHVSVPPALGKAGDIVNQRLQTPNEEAEFVHAVEAAKTAATAY